MAFHLPRPGSLWQSRVCTAAGCRPRIHGKATPQPQPQREAARLSKRLNLSSDQTAKLEPILADRDNKIAALTNDATISPVVMKQQMKAIHRQTRQQLAAILTPDQLQQIKSRRHGQGAPTQTQPQSQPPTNPQAGL